MNSAIIPWAFVFFVGFVALVGLARFGPLAYIAIMCAGILFCAHMAGHLL